MKILFVFQSVVHLSIINKYEYINIYKLKWIQLIQLIKTMPQYYQKQEGEGMIKVIGIIHVGVGRVI